MDRTSLLSAVTRRAGLDEPAHADAIVTATVTALIEHLDAPPRSLTALLGDAKAGETATGPGPSHEALTASLAQSLGVREGIAFEWIDAALTEIAAALPDPVRAAVRAELPSAYAVPFADPQPAAHPRSPAAGPRANTLASGAPGAAHSLADGAPSSTHHMSIAESDDPHGGRTLASAARRGND